VKSVPFTSHKLKNDYLTIPQNLKFVSFSELLDWGQLRKIKAAARPKECD
jgi:hypothetical protein